VETDEKTCTLFLGWNKIDVPCSVSHVKGHLHQCFEWCMVGCESKNGHQKHMWRKEIALRAHNLLSILDMIVNKNWGKGGGYTLISLISRLR